MKKRWTTGRIIWTAVLAILVIYLFIVIEPIRTKKSMTRIANRALVQSMLDEFGKSDYEKKMKELDGPLITDNGAYLSFQWYKVLSWGDSASFYVSVFKKPESLSWRDNFFWPRIGFNDQWYYFAIPEGISAFQNILPPEFANEPDNKKFKIYDNRQKLEDSIKFKIELESLFFFLQKGHFVVEDKKDEYTVVNFYEAIAEIKVEDQPSPQATSVAKVSVNDSLQIEILPVIWNFN